MSGDGCNLGSAVALTGGGGASARGAAFPGPVPVWGGTSSLADAAAGACGDGGVSGAGSVPSGTRGVVGSGAPRGVGVSGICGATGAFDSISEGGIVGPFEPGSAPV